MTKNVNNGKTKQGKEREKNLHDNVTFSNPLKYRVTSHVFIAFDIFPGSLDSLSLSP